MTTRLLLITGLISMIFLSGESAAQDEGPTPLYHAVPFHLIYDPLELAFENWDDTNPPDTVKLDAFRIASGYLMGFVFHYEKSRDIIRVFEQVEVYSDQLEYLGYTMENSNYRFDYICMVPTSHWLSARSGKAFQGHGESGYEDDPRARREARNKALDDAIRAYVRDKYVRQGQPIPGVVDGRVKWFDINNELRDPDSGSYIMDVTAWIEARDE